jgi:hypothetical protein
MRITTFGLLTAVTLLAGCAFGPKMSNLQEGMTRADIQDVLGKPDGYKRVGDYEQLQYANRVASPWGWSYARADYNVVLLNGKVVEYGQGQVRDREVNGAHVLFIAPMR